MYTHTGKKIANDGVDAQRAEQDEKVLGENGTTAVFARPPMGPQARAGNNIVDDEKRDQRSVQLPTTVLAIQFQLLGGHGRRRRGHGGGGGGDGQSAGSGKATQGKKSKRRRLDYCDMNKQNLGKSREAGKGEGGSGEGGRISRYIYVLSVYNTVRIALPPDIFKPKPATDGQVSLGAISMGHGKKQHEADGHFRKMMGREGRGVRRASAKEKTKDQANPQDRSMYIDDPRPDEEREE